MSGLYEQWVGRDIKTSLLKSLTTLVNRPSMM